MIVGGVGVHGPEHLLNGGWDSEILTKGKVGEGGLQPNMTVPRSGVHRFH
jgi:hypothetical protein